MSLEVNGISKQYGNFTALHPLSFTLSEPGVYALLGTNGAGKTTMFKLITGLLSPTAGNIKVQGETLSIDKKDFLRKMGILIETPVFYNHLSARENLEIHLSYMEHSFEKIGQVLEMVGLGDTGKQPVSKFSLGMKQRLAIGRAISHSPQILILDEPINGLDPMGIRQIRNLFLSLAKDGMTLLISSHILSEIEHIADVVGVLTNGNVVQEVAICEIKKQYPNGLEEYFFQIMSGGAEA